MGINSLVKMAVTLAILSVGTGKMVNSTRLIYDYYTLINKFLALLINGSSVRNSEFYHSTKNCLLSANDKAQDLTPYC